MIVTDITQDSTEVTTTVKTTTTTTTNVKTKDLSYYFYIETNSFISEKRNKWAALKSFFLFFYNNWIK